MPTRVVRRTVVGVVLAGGAAMALLGWWVLRAPAIEHHAVALPPDIDIDPPAMRARRNAAIALATMPDDPWTFAESLAPSAPVLAVQKEECGAQDGARFDKPVDPDQAPVQTRGASPRFVNAQARIDAALRASADPLDRVVADLVNIGDMRSAAGRDEAVVQQAAAATDPRVYAVGYELCQSSDAPPASCGSVSLERWSALDPGNGIPWVDLLGRAQARGDAAGVRAALSHLASATRFDTYLTTLAGAVASRVPKEQADLAAANDFTMRAFNVAANLPIPSFQPLLQVCRDHAGGDVERARLCQATGDAMYEHTDSLLVHALSGALQFQMTGDAARRDFIRAERAVAAAHWSPATGLSECRDMRDSMKRLLRESQVGEVETLREQARQFVTP